MSVFSPINKREELLLFLGDIVVFYLSLWSTLFVRYLAIPDWDLLASHATPFSILFVSWIIVFFISGLYEKQTVLLKSKLPIIIFNAQLVNSAIAIAFFYLIPYFNITPKTNLFIYLSVSFSLVVLWRIRPNFILSPKRHENGILIGSGEEMHELLNEVNTNSRYTLKFVSSIDIDEVDGFDFQEEILNRIYSEGITTIVVDTQNEKVVPILPKLYNLMFSSVRFIDMHNVYEDIFDRVPLSLLKYSWFLENVSASTKFTYDFLKRIMDVSLGFIVAIFSLLLYPFIFLAIKFEDGGPIFIKQERIGKNNKIVCIRKFRTMTGDDKGDDVLHSKNTVTKVGLFLRMTRIDELPQIWSVLGGELSLIGPRPELPALVKKYEEEVPYYNVRNLLKPGLSGWAQIYHDAHPHHGVDSDETKVKLSYDLYYIKNRSFLLDLKIALKTIKAILSRAGA
jgi:lipopolysaccharide/colanic/teichoic acid biosynthesis glycosyltransferase